MPFESDIEQQQAQSTQPTSQPIAQYLYGKYAIFSRVNPDDTVRQIEAAHIMGVNPGTFVGIDKNLQTKALEVAQSKKNEPGDWNAFVQQYPKTAAYLNSNNNMAISHDDIYNLSGIEDVVKNSSRLDDLEHEKAEIGLSWEKQGISSLDKVSPADLARVQAINTEMVQLQQQLPSSVWSPSGLLSQIVSMKGAAETGLKYGAVGAGTGLLGGPFAEVTVPGGFATGFRIGMAKDIGTTRWGNSYVDSIMGGSQHPEAAAYTSGVGTAALSSLQVGKWLKIPETTGVKRIFTNAAEQGGIGLGLGAVNVAGQKVASGNYNITSEDVQNIAKNGADMLPLGLALSVPGYGIAGLRRLSQLADESKTAQRLPSAYAEHLSNMAKGSPLEDTQISGEELRNYLLEVEQSKPGDADMIMNKLGVTADQINEAVATNGKVKVDVGNLLTLDKPNKDALFPDTSVNGEPTETEILAKQQELKELMNTKPAEEGETVEAPKTMEEELGIKEESEPNVIEQNVDYQEQMAETEKAINEELDRAQDAQNQIGRFNFSLQLFGSKDPMEIAKNYEKMTSAAKEVFDGIAQEHGFASGKDLADSISRPRDEVAGERMAQAKEQIAKELSGQPTEAKLLTTAKQSAALRNIAKVKADAKNKIYDLKVKLKNLKNRDDYETWWQKESSKKQVKEIQDLIEHHEKELKENSKWRDAEVNAITKQAKIGVKAAMKQAGEYIKGKTINGGLMNVGLYMRQARECLRLAGKWFNKGDHEEAANWKDREMINHAMAMEAIKAVKEIKQIVRFLKPFEKRGISLNGMPIEFASQIDALLGKYGRKNAGSVPAISLRNFITNFNAEDEYGGITIPDSILDGVPKDFKDMPLSELHDLKDAIQSISDVGKNLNKALRTDKKELISDQGKEILSTTEKKVGLNNLPYSGIGSKSLTDAQKAINKLSKATESLVDWGKQLRTIQALCNFMGEPATRYIYDPIHAAYADGISRIHAGWNEVTKGIDQFFSNTSFQDELKKVYKFDFLPGGELTGEELHGVLLNMGNEGNLDRLTNGYFKDDPAAEQKLLQMVSQLPKKFFDLAQHVWDHCESYFPEVRKLEMDVRGIDPKKVEARPFTAITSEGGKVNMRGGYFHISYDYEKGEQVPRTSTQLNELYKQVSVAHTMTEHGHTEARTSGGDKKLNLRVWQEVIPHFISNVNYDLAMRRSIIDVNRLLKTKDVETAVTGALSRDSYIRMRQWLTAVAQDQRGTDYNAFLRGLRQRVMLSQLGINLKAFPEFIPTNFLMVAGKKGILPTIQGISDYYFGGKREELVDKIHSKSVMMKNRVRFGLVDRDINEFSNTILGNKVNSVRAFMLAMHSLADETISMPAWNKEYDDAIAEGVPEQEAINRADGLITENFGSGILPDQAEVMRGSQGKKLMTMYYSWYNMLFNKYWSTLKQSGTQFQQGENIAAAQTLIHGAFYYWVLPGLISGIVNTTLNNTLGKNQTMQQNIKEIEKDVALYPVRTVPIIGSAIDYLVSQSLGQRTEYSLSPVESLPKLALEFGTALWKHQAGKNESTAEKGARLASMTVGYPQRVNTWVFNAYDWMNRNGDHTLAQALKDMFTRESKHR